MLIGFRVGNFRSFAADQTVHYSAFPDRAHESAHYVPTGLKAVPRLSKIAAIFGPNAGGKTNFLLGLATLRDLVLHSTAYSDSQFAENYTPFRFGLAPGSPTDFEIDVLLCRVRYRYALSHDAQRIRSERLLVYRTGKAQRWFERRFDELSQEEYWAPFSLNFTGPREMWRKATRPKALFLTTAAQLNSELLQPLFNWFAQGIDIVVPSETADRIPMATRIRDPGFKGRVLGLLRSVDLPVDDVRVAEPDLSPLGAATPGKFAANHSSNSLSPPAMEFLHARPGQSPVWLRSTYEAAGIQRLFELSGPLLETLEGGKLLVIDEFDAGLHPLVARYLIKLINDRHCADRCAQLLLTSHNTALMNPDILRRDEIWLIELGTDGASSLSPLRSKPHTRELVAKGYLRGHYGAVPEVPREPFTPTSLETRAASGAQHPAIHAPSIAR